MVLLKENNHFSEFLHFATRFYLTLRWRRPAASWNCHMQPPTPFVVVVVLFMLGLCCSLVHNEAQLSLVVFHNL